MSSRFSWQPRVPTVRAYLVLPRRSCQRINEAPAGCQSAAIARCAATASSPDQRATHAARAAARMVASVSKSCCPASIRSSSCAETVSPCAALVQHLCFRRCAPHDKTLLCSRKATGHEPIPCLNRIASITKARRLLARRVPDTGFAPNEDLAGRSTARWRRTQSCSWSNKVWKCVPRAACAANCSAAAVLLVAGRYRSDSDGLQAYPLQGNVHKNLGLKDICVHYWCRQQLYRANGKERGKRSTRSRFHSWASGPHLTCRTAHEHSRKPLPAEAAIFPPLPFFAVSAVPVQVAPNQGQGT